MRFGDGGVALAERPVEAGRVLVWGSTLDSGWNDLAVQGVFLPFLHEMVKYAAGYNPGRSWLTVGDPFDLLSMGPTAQQFDIMLTPSGERTELGEQTDISLSEVGFYELRSAGGQGDMALAVNVDPSEAEPATFDPEEMRTALLTAASVDQGAASSDASLTLVEREKQQRGWWYLVILAFAILVGETIFSNWIGSRRRRSAGGIRPTG
jgi:hypothetical protein